jgi:hypothetical protein
MPSSGADSDRVDLTELDVITRYSLAVRHASADRSELIEALRADLKWLEGGRRTPSRSVSSRKTAAHKTTSRRAR